jgi:hypothetical protein
MSENMNSLFEFISMMKGEFMSRIQTQENEYREKNMELDRLYEMEMRSIDDRLNRGLQTLESMHMAIESESEEWLDSLEDELMSPESGNKAQYIEIEYKTEKGV